MRFGCCLNMIALPEDPTGIGSIGVIKSAGFDYVELPLAQVSELSEPAFEMLLEALEKSGIPCETANNSVPPYVKLTGPEADPVRIAAFFESALKRASLLGIKQVGIGSPGARNTPVGYSRLKGLDELKVTFAIAGDIGESFDIGINIEPVNMRDCNILTAIGECVEFHEELGHKNVGLMVDYYHLAADREPVSEISKMAGKIKHAHIASLERRLFPKPGDPDDYAAFSDQLKTSGYDGRLSIEAYAENLEADAADSVEFLGSIFR